MQRNHSGMGQCPVLIKHPPAEYNGVIDHLMSSLKPCFSSHSFNKGKMSTVYRAEKMDHLIFCHWLWDMFMKSWTATHRSLWGYSVLLSLPFSPPCSLYVYQYYKVQFPIISAPCLLTRHHYRAMTVNCNCTSLLLCHNYSCDGAQGENDLIVSG